MIKILIADDDIDFTNNLRDLLEAEGFDVFAAHEGVRVIEIAHKQKPDLILLDLKMPAGTGQSVLEALKTKKDTSPIPVIVVTGLAGPSLKEEVLAKGARDFITKGFDPNFLLEKIRQHLVKTAKEGC